MKQRKIWNTTPTPFNLETLLYRLPPYTRSKIMILDFNIEKKILK
jgi:hypothetical protein